MTQDEIIRMAREAGIAHAAGIYMEHLERFAALVAAHEAKEHLKMLENLREETKAHCLQAMAEAYEMGKQDEREACAKVCEGHGHCYECGGGLVIAEVIRERGEK